MSFQFPGREWAQMARQFPGSQLMTWYLAGYHRIRLFRHNAGMVLIEINSSAIQAVGYDGHTLTVVFRTGKTYDHPQVPNSVYLGLMQAESKGAYYNRHIRGRYR